MQMSSTRTLLTIRHGAPYFTITMRSEHSSSTLTHKIPMSSAKRRIALNFNVKGLKYIVPTFKRNN